MNDKERELCIEWNNSFSYQSVLCILFSWFAVKKKNFFLSDPHPGTKTKWSKNIFLSKGEKNVFGRAGDGRWNQNAMQRVGRAYRLIQHDTEHPPLTVPRCWMWFTERRPCWTWSSRWHGTGAPSSWQRCWPSSSSTCSPSSATCSSRTTSSWRWTLPWRPCSWRLTVSALPLAPSAGALLAVLPCISVTLVMPDSTVFGAGSCTVGLILVRQWKI